LRFLHRPLPYFLPQARDLADRGADRERFGVGDLTENFEVHDAISSRASA